MKHRMSLPADLVDEVERMAATSGRPVDLEYGRLLALGLLSKLAEELMPLFPELSQPALPSKPEKRSKLSLRTPPSINTHTATQSVAMLPDAGLSSPVPGEHCNVAG